MQRLAPWLIALIAIAVCGWLLVRDHQRQLEVVSLRARVADLAAAQNHQVEARVEAERGRQLEATRLEAQKERQRAVERVEAVFSGATTAGTIDNAMRNDPAFTALWRRQQLHYINHQYGAAIDKLNLPPDQLAKLKDLLIDRNAAVMDARDAAENSGLTNAERDQAVSQATSEVTKEIEALAGPGFIGQIGQAAQNFAMAVAIQNQVGVDFAAAGVPLSNDQLSALSGVYADLWYPERLQKTPDLAKLVGAPADPITGLTPLNQAMLDQAAQVLSSAQLPILRQSLIDQNLQQAFIQQQQAAAQAGK